MSGGSTARKGPTPARDRADAAAAPGVTPIPVTTTLASPTPAPCNRPRRVMPSRLGALDAPVLLAHHSLPARGTSSAAIEARQPRSVGGHLMRQCPCPDRTGHGRAENSTRTSPKHPPTDRRGVADHTGRPPTGPARGLDHIVATHGQGSTTGTARCSPAKPGGLPRASVVGHSGAVRPRLALALLAAAVFCLIIAVVPFQTETRLVGLGGLVLFLLMYAAERRRGQRAG
jgi:hypothetical protein